jgi:outer membrane protein OmpA-like peptidoglycan-associated protein
MCLLPASNGFTQINSNLKSTITGKLERQLQKAATKSLPENKESHSSETIQDNPGSNATRAAYKSKFDFVPGERVIRFYDFADVTVGDIPSDWQIDGSAEVVEVEGYPGKYLMIQQKSAVLPYTFEDLPDEITVQFDIICTNPFAWGSSKLYFILAQVDPNRDINGMQNQLGNSNNKVLWLSFHPGSQSAVANKGYGNYEMITREGTRKGENYPMESFIDTDEGRLAKISIWRQKRRMRVYVNENKVLDMTTLLPEGIKLNAFVWNVYSGYYNEDKYFIGNIRVAEGMPDTRKNLAANGKYVTTGILFDVNSDVIKPESYGILKEISNMIKANPGTKMTIIGHTDSDGDDAKNLELSRSRAESVKKALVKEYGIDGSLLSTDGKGETEPVNENDTPQNKANNRRVEFVIGS